MNCTYNFENTCYDKSIDYGNYFIGGLLLFGLFAIPIYCATRHCQIKRQQRQQRQQQYQNTNNRIILIPGYVHNDADSELPPEYKETNDPERIV